MGAAKSYASGRARSFIQGNRTKASKPAVSSLMGNKSWWQTDQLNASSSMNRDWRGLGDFSVSRGAPRKNAGLGRAAVSQALFDYGQRKAAQGAKPTPATATTGPSSAAMATAPDLGRRFNFLHGVSNVYGASGEVGGPRALGAGPHPSSDMRFGKGKPYGVGARGYDLTNVREGGSGWTSGQPDEHLSRGASFELGRGMLALPPGRTVIDTTEAAPQRRKPGMNPIKHAEITSELKDVVSSMEAPLVQPTQKKKRRPAGANPAALKAARGEWPALPGQPSLGL